jgi:PAS domain-containing protein
VRRGLSSAPSVADTVGMAIDQRPIQLILARGLMSNLTTPAFLVDAAGTLVFYNEAAGDLLGMRYEEAGPLVLQDWGTRFIPLGDDGEPIAVQDLPLPVALRENRPVHVRFSVRSKSGDVRKIEVSAFPIVGNAGMQGAMAIFWDATEH